MSINVNDIEFSTDVMTFPNSNVRDCKCYASLEFADAVKSNKRYEIMVVHFN